MRKQQQFHGVFSEQLETRCLFSGPFSIGDLVTSTTSGLNVRNSPNGSIIGQQNNGATGSVQAGGTFTGGYTWYSVDWASGTDGWSADLYLNKVAANPQIGSVSPNPVTGSNSPQPFTVYGSNFASGAFVRVKDLTNGGTYDKTPTSSSNSQLTISPNFTTAAATWSAQVINPDGGGSNVVNFSVIAPTVRPYVNSVSPNPVTGSNSAQLFTVYGGNFVSDAIVRLQDLTNGGTYDKSPTSFDSSQLTISANFTTAQAVWSAQVINPGGAASGTINFTVNTPVVTPTVNSVSPNPVTGSNTAQPFTVYGSSFASGAIVRLKDLTNGGTYDKTPTSNSGTQLVISANFTTAQANWSAQVINPGGAASNGVNFTVNAPTVTPYINSVSPNPVTGSNTAQPFTVNGTDFASGAIVRLKDLTNGGTYDKTPTSSSGTQLIITGNFTTAQANWSAQVINPGGTASNVVNFNVNAPTTNPPSITSVSPNPVPPSSSSQTLTINGANFQTGAALTFTTPGGSVISSTASKLNVVNAVQITYQFNNDNDAGTWSVKVNNPDGKSSAMINFTVSNVVVNTPTIRSVTTPVTGSSTSQNFTVSGAFFAAGAIVRLKDLTNGGTYDKAPISSSATQLVISANFTTAQANWSAQVINPGNVGSNVVAFVVTAPVTTGATLKGMVWSDADKDGVLDSNESGVASRTVYLDPNNNSVYDIGEQYTTTDASGNYTFTGLVSGTYKIREILPAGWSQTSPSNNYGNNATVSGTKVVTGFNFGTVQIATTVAPLISGVTPSPVPPSASNQTLTITGANFKSGATLTFTKPSGSSFQSIATNLVVISSTQITYQLNNANDVGVWSLKVNNPDGKVSNTATFSVAMVTPGAVYEAENASLGGGSAKSTSYSGYTGTGYVDYGGSGSYVEWVLARSSAGNTKLELRYANGSTTNRTMTVKINGISFARLPFEPTGSWTTWKTVSITAPLNSGTNNVRVVAEGNGGPNVDKLTVSGGSSAIKVNHSSFISSFKSTFGTSTSTGGLDQLLSLFEADQSINDVRWASYMFATVLAECGGFLPVEESVALRTGKPYNAPDPVTGFSYYGRGYVQLTWNYNYKNLGAALGVDLYNNPGLALRPDIAYRVMSYGLRMGSFTGVGLAWFINDAKTDYTNARKTVNGLDKASTIASNATKFESILRDTAIA